MTFDALVEEFLLLRLQVAYQGEQAPSPWWSTSCLSDDAELDFRALFGDAAPMVAWQISMQSACDEHDKRISGMDYHLFRLPEGLEEAIYHLGLRLPVNIAQAWLDRKSELASFGGSSPLSVNGPQQVGDSTSLLDGTALTTLRNIYAQAFETNTQAYPYFVDAN